MQALDILGIVVCVTNKSIAHKDTNWCGITYLNSNLGFFGATLPTTNGLAVYLTRSLELETLALG